jgi:hypothetical protein
MCGITGIFDIRDRRDIDRAVLQRMNDSQLHRGPDEGSVHIEPRLGFGHRRLSIIDIATGQQPLFNEDGSVVVVFNGEIYNYQELIPELQAAGHVFHTKSEIDVIVHAWQQWGEACVERFRGMFAFALWDRNHQTLFLARDRLGFKPMHDALCGDLRNSKVIDIIRDLQSDGVDVFVTDPQADLAEAMHEYGVQRLGWNDLPCADAVVAAVAHREYAGLSVEDFGKKMVKGGAFIDVKAAFDAATFAAAGYRVWRL